MENEKQVATAESKQLARATEKGLLEKALSYVKTNNITLPKNYDVAGAVNGFYLRLLDTVDRNKRPALEVCTSRSIEKALRDMTSGGLDPRKKQVYLIVRGNQLQIQESYFGNQKKAKTYDLRLSDFHAQVVYKGDEYETKIEMDGRKTLVKHVQKFGTERTSENIVYAYSIVLVDGLADLEDMTRAEILQAWAKSPTVGTIHKEFPSEMAKKTVINRHAKRFINTSDDSSLMEESAKKQKVLDISSEVIDMSGPERSSEISEDINDTENSEDVGESLPEASSFDDKEPKIINENICSVCKANLTDLEKKYSKKTFNVPYCTTCQPKK